MDMYANIISMHAMEFEFDLSPIFILVSFSVFVFVIVFEFLKISKPKQNLPPGPRKLPFIGNLHLLAGSSPPHHTLRDIAMKHGPLMHLKLGEVDHLVVSSAEIATQFLKTHDIVFAFRPSVLATEIGCYGNTDIVYSPYGDYWRQLRRICVLELLSSKRVQSFRYIREEEVLEQCRWMASQEGSAVNLTEKIGNTNYDIMMRAALGKKTDEQVTIIKIIKEGLKINSGFNIIDLYPSLRSLNVVSGKKWKIEKYHRRMDMIGQNIIDQRKREKASDKDNHVHDDLLDVLLRLQDDGSLQTPLTNDNIKAVLLDLYAAGVDPSTTAVDWAMAEMLKNPRILKKAQDEVREVFDGKNHIVDERFFEELKYLKLVVRETLRLHPSTPLLLPRESREHCQINGYEIAAGTRVLVNAWAIGRDPRYWDDAERFIPERFLENPVDFKGGNMEYIPFGAGRRICPGISFGIANVEHQLAMLLYHFDWILPNLIKPEDVDMTEIFALSARRKYSLLAIPLVRRPLP